MNDCTMQNDYENFTKKRKFDDMVDGSIIQLSLTNFMTFSEITYNAHPKLNLIIGPNGSGKSSIVTALILGFGGNPKDINRGDKVGQFVKLGTDVADISIELYKKSSKNIHLRRQIFASNYACQYYIDNISVTKKKYIDLVESFNIKVHNLCQFLPQDRLEDFSKLDSKGLLLNTLQSIDNQDLLLNFEKLKELASNLYSFDDDKKKLQNAIILETSTNLKLETIVNSFAEKKSLEKQLLAVLQKRCWSLYILAWEHIKDENKKFEDAKEYNHGALKIIVRQKKIIENKKTNEYNLKKIVLQNANIVNKLLEKLNNKVGLAECCVSDLNALNNSVKISKRKIENYKLSISNMQESIKKNEIEVLNYEDNKKEIVVIDKQIKKIDESLYPIKSNLENVKHKLNNATEKMNTIDQGLEREKGKEDSKNQLIQRKFPEMWKAINWLRNCDKTSIFHGQVFEPLFTQIEMLDQKMARYIESIVNYRDMIAFVFEYAEDLTTFNKIVKQEHWQRINSISAPPANLHINETAKYDINELKQFGFYAYALDMINVPSVIRRYLIRNYDMHNIPIGSKNVINHLQHLPKDIGYFFAGNDQVNIRISMYTGEKITRQTQISSEAQFLLFSVNSNLIRSLTTKKEKSNLECKQLEQILTKAMNQLKIAEDSRQPFFERKKEILGSIRKFQNKQIALSNETRDLEFTRSELKKEEEKSMEYENQNLKLINTYFDSMKEVIDLLDSYAVNLKSFMSSAFIFKNCCFDLYEENKVLKELKTLYMTNMNSFNEYLKYVQKLESEFKKMLQVALHWSRGVSPYDKTLFLPLKQSFDKIKESDIEDLDTLIVENTAKLNCLHIDPKAPQLIREYKDRKLRIKNMEKNLEDLINNVQSKEVQIESINSEWFPELNKLVNLLCSNFQKFLISFGCNGIVELDTGVTKYDFKSYGILIKVQFRKDVPSLRQLDTKCQSGGERALTTALFLLALQEVTHFPFRIVDEINQGMDKVYEKKLMELFMELFENRTDQYLVVTPKLIKNLSFKNTTVEIIFRIEK